MLTQGTASSPGGDEDPLAGQIAVPWMVDAYVSSFHAYEDHA